ncbi:hypothetical protein DBZ36_17425 [Alginatibacterium sediminis]|uniref:Uncharacterized protein n=1 Tax=Alginatibacterium sediminis TaxID=2164068 RepID=A0A420E7H3_9ALTE|nr:hypothetical protein [Alginatibacterium sediminis]RKF14434.1 hypothetical protein DBZ36_17425 [Alginatibacterium sediminis]
MKHRLNLHFYTVLKLFIIASIAPLSGCGGDSKSTQSIQQAQVSSYAASVSSDGHYSVMSDSSGSISVWDLFKQQEIYLWKQQNDNHVFITRIAADNEYVVTASRQDFAIWSLTDGQAQGYWSIAESNIRDIAISSNARYVLIGLVNGKVLHLDLDTGRRLEFLGHSEKINSVALSPNGRYALTGGNDYQALLWDTQSAQIILRFPQSSRVSMVALDDSGQYAFTADSGKQARIWSIPSGELVSELNLIARQTLFTSVQFSADQQWLVTGSAARKVGLWRVSDGKQLAQYMVSPKRKTRPESAVVYSAAAVDGTQIISASSSGLVEYWPISQ